MRDTRIWIGFAIVAIGIAGLVTADIFADMSALRGEDVARLVASTALLIVIGGGALRAYQGRGSMLLTHVAIWLGILAVLALIYQYREALGLSFD